MSYDVPRPKRSQFTHRVLSGGKWFDAGAYNNAVALWEDERRKHNDRRRGEAPYTEVGGGNPCEACDGTGVCNRCDGTSWYKLRNGTSVRCKACEPRGPRASEADRGKCWPCHGSGKERPTRHRRD